MPNVWRQEPLLVSNSWLCPLSNGAPVREPAVLSLDRRRVAFTPGHKRRISCCSSPVTGVREIVGVGGAGIGINIGAGRDAKADLSEAPRNRPRRRRRRVRSALAVAPGWRRDDLPGERPEAAGADFAFPDDEDTPAGLPQLALMLPVSLLGPLQLGLPIVRVAVRDAPISAPCVLVPKTAVDEDCRRVALEYNVGSPREAGKVLPEPESLAVEIRSNPPLRCRLGASNLAHHPAARLGRNRIGHDLASLLDAFSPCYRQTPGWWPSPAPRSAAAVHQDAPPFEPVRPAMGGRVGHHWRAAVAAQSSSGRESFSPIAGGRGSALEPTSLGRSGNPKAAASASGAMMGRSHK